MFGKPWLPLRLSALISLIFSVGHTLGGLKGWSPIGDTEVLSAMRAFRFDVAGVNRSYYEFYRGFGFLLTVYLVLQAVLLWQLASLSQANRSLARPLVWSFFLASIPIGFLTWAFLFPTPVYFDVVLTACLGWALSAVARDERERGQART
jgi:hypothetical protein